MKNKKIKVKWVDAVLYGPSGQDEITEMKTSGILIRDSKDFLIIKNPKTTKIKTKKKHPKKGTPSFYFIPKGMVLKIEEIS